MLDLLNPQVVGQIIYESDQTEDQDRRRNAFKAFQVYSGNSANYVQQELRRTRPKSWKSYTVSNISLSKMVVQKRAQAYDSQPMREVYTDGVSSDVKTEAYQNILKEADAHRNLCDFDELFNLHKYALLWANYHEPSQKYQLITLAPYEFILVRDKDTGEVLCVALNYPDEYITAGSGTGDGQSNLISESQADSSAQSRVYAMWTKDQHVVVKYAKRVMNTGGKQETKIDVDFVPIEGNPNNINPLGVLPFVFLSQDLSVDYPTPNPLTDQTITYNLLMSELLTSSSIQGTGQLVIKLPASMVGKIDGLEMGLTSAIELPQSDNPNDAATDATYINPSPDLAGQKESYTSWLRQVLAEHGITAAQGLDGSTETFSSGLERAIAQADVQKIVTRNQNLYSMVEKQLFKIFKAWESHLGRNTFSEGDELSVRFPKQKVMVSDGEILNNIEKRLNLGLMEKWEALVAIDPNLSETEAKEKLERIESERNQNMRSFVEDNEEA